MEKKKLRLKELNINSFVTTQESEMNTIQGGNPLFVFSAAIGLIWHYTLDEKLATLIPDSETCHERSLYTYCSNVQ